MEVQILQFCKETSGPSGHLRTQLGAQSTFWWQFGPGVTALHKGSDFPRQRQGLVMKLQTRQNQKWSLKMPLGGSVG